MMGTKLRDFAPLPNLSLEELVRKDNFYRRLEATLDLSFLGDLVKECYACSGRPSVDPVVFFRLQLVMFFENIRSERQLMEVAADRLSIRMVFRGRANRETAIQRLATFRVVKRLSYNSLTHTLIAYWRSLLALAFCQVG